MIQRAIENCEISILDLWRNQTLLNFKSMILFWQDSNKKIEIIFYDFEMPKNIIINIIPLKDK
jgi:hypothetical protein